MNEKENPGAKPALSRKIARWVAKCAIFLALFGLVTTSTVIWILREAKANRGLVQDLTRYNQDEKLKDDLPSVVILSTPEFYTAQKERVEKLAKYYTKRVQFLRLDPARDTEFTDAFMGAVDHATSKSTPRAYPMVVFVGRFHGIRAVTPGPIGSPDNLVAGIEEALTPDHRLIDVPLEPERTVTSKR
jgi:hypothetical protein